MLRLTVLTDSVRAVRAASDTLSKLGLATSPLERVAHGCRAVAAADGVFFQESRILGDAAVAAAVGQ